MIDIYISTNEKNSAISYVPRCFFSLPPIIFCIEYGNLSVRSVPTELITTKWDGGCATFPPPGCIVRFIIRENIASADDLPLDNDDATIIAH